MSYILHRDAQRVTVVTGIPSQGIRRSLNAKTGDMLQVWIMAADVSPVAAVQTGAESLVCGNCRHAGAFGKRTCYVNVNRGPLSVWQAVQRGSYAFLPRSRYAEVFGGRSIRWGAYGDPCYVPLDVLGWASFFSAGWTGYTHQWAQYPELRGYLMASVDSERELADARSLGWRTFRVRAADESLGAREITCPASDEAGHRTTCAACKLCNGVRYVMDPRKDISILAHGANAHRFVQIGV